MVGGGREGGVNCHFESHMCMYIYVTKIDILL